MFIFLFRAISRVLPFLLHNFDYYQNQKEIGTQFDQYSYNQRSDVVNLRNIRYIPVKKFLFLFQNPKKFQAYSGDSPPCKFGYTIYLMLRWLYHSAPLICLIMPKQLWEQNFSR